MYYRVFWTWLELPIHIINGSSIGPTWPVVDLVDMHKTHPIYSSKEYIREGVKKLSGVPRPLYLHHFPTLHHQQMLCKNRQRKERKIKSRYINIFLKYYIFHFNFTSSLSSFINKHFLLILVVSINYFVIFICPWVHH